MKLCYYLACIIFAITLTACETTRTNAPQKVRNSVLTRCNTMVQCERVTNG